LPFTNITKELQAFLTHICFNFPLVFYIHW